MRSVYEPVTVYLIVTFSEPNLDMGSVYAILYPHIYIINDIILYRPNEIPTGAFDCYLPLRE